MDNNWKDDWVCNKVNRIAEHKTGLTMVANGERGVITKDSYSVVTPMMNRLLMEALKLREEGEF